jgi:hypothetical protein
MDTRRCLEILELKSITSPDELKQAYRDMAQIWHPDRFHGNPRLQRIASTKLKEINQAYNNLLAYFDPEQRARLKRSISPPRDRSSKINDPNRPENYSGERTATLSANRNRDDPQAPNPTGRFKVYPAKKRSNLGKFFFFFALCFFLVIAGLVIYFVLNMDRLTAGSIGIASEAMQKMKIELEKELANKLGENENLPPGNLAPKSDIIDLSKETRPGKSVKYFEIHLEGDTVIMTRSWWQEGDMIMYNQFGGSMGVEKSRVKRIVERQATRSKLPF